MQAAAFRRNVRFWVSCNDALLGLVEVWAVGFRLGASLYVSSGCDLLGFVRTRAAGFRLDASCWVSSGEGGALRSVRMRIAGFVWGGFVQSCAAGFRRDGSYCFVLARCRLLGFVFAPAAQLRRKRVSSRGAQLGFAAMGVVEFLRGANCLISWQKVLSSSALLGFVVARAAGFGQDAIC